jgi:hypothetical protein
LTLTAVNGYGLTFPSSGGAGVQAIITTHIDQVRAETQIDTPTALDDVNEPMQVRVFIPTVRR